MSSKRSPKRIVACFVALAIFTATGIGLSTAEGWGGPGLIPKKAFNPDPPDGDTGVPPEDVLLTWSAGQGAVLHDIYTSDPNLVGWWRLEGRQSETTFDLGPLDPGQTYYWRVDEVAADGTLTVGDVWSFETSYYWRVD